MDLLIIFKIYLALGSVCYLLTILSFIRRHTPKIKITDSHKETAKEKEDRQNDRKE